MADFDLNKTVDPRLVEQIYAAAYHHYENGKYEEAVRLFRFLIVSDVNSRRNWMGLAASQQMLKEYDEAIKSYTFAALMDDHDPYVFFYAAECLISKGDIPLGLQMLGSVKKAAGKQEKYKDLLAQTELLEQAWSSKQLME